MCLHTHVRLSIHLELCSVCLPSGIVDGFNIKNEGDKKNLLDLEKAEINSAESQLLCEHMQGIVKRKSEELMNCTDESQVDFANEHMLLFYLSWDALYNDVIRQLAWSLPRRLVQKLPPM